MYIEKDLAKIKSLGIKREKDNIRFRTELKSIDKTFEEIDSIVHKIYRDVIEEIDCTQCANCCIEMSPVLNDNDIKKLSVPLGIEIEEFKKSYLDEIEMDGNMKRYRFNSAPCPFLQDKLCTHYESRPGDCHEFPHVHKKDFSSRLWGMIDNYSICPIVYNVFEELKYEIRINQ
jgi:Fe-S-cluster containining protein